MTIVLDDQRGAIGEVEHQYYTALAGFFVEHQQAIVRREVMIRIQP
jgi:hypothetical protein